MTGIDLIKEALKANVVEFPKNFVEENGVEAKLLGYTDNNHKAYYVPELDKSIIQLY